MQGLSLFTLQPTIRITKFNTACFLSAMAIGIGTPSIGPISSPKSVSADLSIMEEAKLKFKHALRQDVSVPRSPSSFQKIVAEIVGTYILIYVGCGAGLVNRVATLTAVGIGVVWGLVVMALVYALGHISGAHFNPAVTIALAAAGRFPLLHVPMYVMSQFLGSTLACLTLRLLFNTQHDILPTITQYKSPTTDLEAITWEFIISFILMFIICAVATDDRANKALSGVAIGGTILFNVTIAGPITGASMNPARSVGPALVSGEYKNLWVYVVAPILGALAATLVYSVLRLPESGKDEDQSIKSNYNDLFLGSDV